jgi:selenocysteine lyase/cysteine desulfurase
MGAGIGELLAKGINSVRTHHRNLTAQLIDGLREVQGVQLIGPANADRQVGVLSLQINGYDPQDVAAILDSTYRIQLRAGFHCASQTHRGLGTDAGGGTVRISVGIATTAEDVDATIAAFAEIAASTT